jgi:hypothetical protein
MQAPFLRFLTFLGLASWFLLPARGAPQNGGDFSQNAQAKRLPTNTILVKGAWSSASDSTTPLPEGGGVVGRAYSNAYFGLTYPLRADWIEKYKGPPPSDTGYYVLAQIRPSDTYKGTTRASVLITAQDLFFTTTAAANAMELISAMQSSLKVDYVTEQPPTLVRMADRSFFRFDYFSPVAELHWHVLATQIRCHMVQFVFTSRDTQLLESLIEDMGQMKLPAEAGPISGTGGGEVPVCSKGYARDENILTRVDPVMTERTFNPIPVRIVIDRDGKVKHIHFLSAFPDQAKAITDALWQWRFKPYLRDGRAVEVETGIVFGRALGTPTSVATSGAKE